MSATAVGQSIEGLPMNTSDRTNVLSAFVRGGDSDALSAAGASLAIDVDIEIFP